MPRSGLLLSIGDPMAEILQIDRVKAVVGIPESDVDAVRNIAEVDLTIQALDNRQVTGSKYFLVLVTGNDRPALPAGTRTRQPGR